MRVPSLGIGLLLACSCTCLAVASVHAASAADGAPAAQAKSKRPSDAQIKQILIDESIAAYSGNCPCPYNRASNGSRCGRRSAYSRAGGEEPLCYAKDVSAQMVQEYRDAHADD